MVALAGARATTAPLAAVPDDAIVLAVSLAVGTRPLAIDLIRNGACLGLRRLDPRDARRDSPAPAAASRESRGPGSARPRAAERSSSAWRFQAQNITSRAPASSVTTRTRTVGNHVPDRLRIAPIIDQLRFGEACVLNVSVQWFELPSRW